MVVTPNIATVGGDQRNQTSIGIVHEVRSHVGARGLFKPRGSRRKKGPAGIRKSTVSIEASGEQNKIVNDKVAGEIDLPIMRKTLDPSDETLLHDIKAINVKDVSITRTRDSTMTAGSVHTTGERTVSLNGDLNADSATSLSLVKRLLIFFTRKEDHAAHPPFELDWSAVQHLEVLWCCLVLIVFGTLHAAAGIGGGGVYVVILMLIGNLDPYDAVPLSKVVIFFGAVAYSLASMVYEYLASPQESEQEPNANDGVAACLVIPMALCGTSWGVYLNTHAPGYVVVFALNIVLFIMTCVVVWQAVKRRAAEDLAADEKSDAVAASSVTAASPQDPDMAMPEVVQMKKTQAVESCTYSQLIVNWILLILTVLSSVAYHRYKACVEGTAAENCTRFPLQLLGLRNCPQPQQHWDWKWSLPICLPLWLCAGTGLHAGVRAYRQHDWSIGSVTAYMGMALATGIVSGLVGVGGGLIFSPFFVITGMDPVVAVSTSSLCVLFTSSSTSFSYLLTDRVITTLAFTFGLAVTPASFAGAAIVQYLQHMPRSKSYITLIVAIGILVSLICSTLKMGIMIEASQK